MALNLRPIFFMGIRDSFCVMLLPLGSATETVFEQLQGTITDALRRCDSTTWDGNPSTYGHARFRAFCSPRRTALISLFKDRALFLFIYAYPGASSLFPISITNSYL